MTAKRPKMIKRPKRDRFVTARRPVWRPERDLQMIKYLCNTKEEGC